jgi:hypothetical protein
LDLKEILEIERCCFKEVYFLKKKNPKNNKPVLDIHFREERKKGEK